MSSENELSPAESNLIPTPDRPSASAWLMPIVLFTMTLLIYSPACQNGFVAWDDNLYVYEQPQVLNGLRPDGIEWASTAKVAGNWHPLTLMSLQLDASLFGTGPFGFHLTSIFLHAINSSLAFLAVFSLTGRRSESVLVALLFALHPMHVESVAWISERKDVLSGLFFFLTLIAYSNYAKSPSAGRYFGVILAFALGLSAKSMLVTLPCLLLLLDFWPLARWQQLSGTPFQKLRRLFVEKLTLFGLSAANCYVTILYQKDAIQPLSRLPFGVRIENAIVSYFFYLYQTCWPLGLSPYYARHSIPNYLVWVSLATLAALTGLAIWQVRSRPYLLVGWLWFVGMLVPVIGVFQVGHHARADRYMYLPHVGLFLALVWWGSDLIRHSQRKSTLAITLFAAIFCGCSVLTVQQIAVWHDTKTLFESARRLDPSNPLATYILAEMLYGEGKKDEAAQMMKHAIEAEDRSDCETLIMLGMLIADCGEYDDCVKALDKALKSHPDDAGVISNRGKALAALGKWQEAADSYRRASELSPGATNFRFYLAYALGKLGQHEESKTISAAALRQSPQWPQNIAAKAWKMSTSPDPKDRGHFWPICLAEQANELTGGEAPEYLDVVGAAYAEAGRFEEAAAIAEKAVKFAEKQNKKTYVRGLRQRLEMYRRREPYREQPPAAVKPAQ